MWDWLVDPFAFGFMRNALAAGLLTAVATSLVGTWLVLRGMAFMGDALAHGVLPGLTTAYLLQVSLALGAAVAALVVIGGVQLIHRRSRLRADTGIGLLFVGTLALGVVIASQAQSYAGDLTAILFGAILAVTGTDIAVAAGTAAVALAAILLLYRPLLALALNERMAAVLGLRPRLAHAALLVLLAGTVIVSFRSVGTLLVFGFLIAPPATATLLARRVPLVMLAALAFATVGVIAGLLVSFHAGTAGAATIAAIMVAEFFAVLVTSTLWTRLRARLPKRRAAPHDETRQAPAHP